MKQSEEFFYPVELSDGRSYPIKEMTVRQYIVLQKTMLLENPLLLNEFVDNIILENGRYPEKFPSLNFIDKLLILITMRCVSVGPGVNLETLPPRSVNLYEIRDQILQECLPYQKNIKTKKSIDVEIGYPKTLFYNEHVDILDETLVSIWGHNMESLSKDERDDLFGRIPIDLFRSINKVVEETIEELTHVKIKTGIRDEPYSLEYKKCELPYVIIYLFKENLMNFMELQYRYFSDMQGDYEHFMNSSPLELSLFVKFHNKKVQEENDRQEKEASKNRIK